MNAQTIRLLKARQEFLAATLRVALQNPGSVGSAIYALTDGRMSLVAYETSLRYWCAVVAKSLGETDFCQGLTGMALYTAAHELSARAASRVTAWQFELEVEPLVGLGARKFLREKAAG